ncbi:hypothetical protein E1293_07090 [Actinomadura darangshiensis]|uniref:Uncharacterized protein n=1 Tax=Actinomadura darangshiensis TaxID=705336 RepID=A0A4R5BR18_9ACTN|nr:hypothetical protein [Actinomadura darangshiensis]TDD87976.1 hypothetical protein E1293_07090 [Actinomadura darangshiensis]
MAQRSEDDRAAAAPPSADDLAVLLRAAGITHLPGGLERTAEAHAMFRGFGERLAALDLGDTPPATVFDPEWR